MAGAISNIGTLSLIATPGEMERRYFLNNPDITFFKSVYRRHTNFSKFLRIIDDTSTPNKFGEPSSYQLDGSIGDLITKVYLQNKISFTTATSGTNINIYANLGSNIIKKENESIKFEIGTNTIYNYSGLYQEVKSELLNEAKFTINGDYTQSPSLEDIVDPSNTDSDPKKKITCRNGSHYNYTTFSGGVIGLEISDDDTEFNTEYFYTIPEFSFMKDYGLALPLCSLRNEDIFFKVDYAPLEDVMTNDDSHYGVGPGDKPKLESKCIVEYVHLDVDEKKRFLTNSHEYIIENVREIKISANENTASLTGISGLIKYILLAGTPLDTGPFSENKSKNVLKELNFDTLNLKLDNNNLNNEPLPKEIYTRLELNRYFKGGGRDLNEEIILQTLADVDAGEISITLTSITLLEKGMELTGHLGINSNTIIQSIDNVTNTITINTATTGDISIGDTIKFSKKRNLGHFDTIGVFPIAIDPMNYTQPSGCISNVQSGISEISLDFTGRDQDSNGITIYVVNYNILRISDGRCQKMVAI